jgi:hypothetical protein
MYEIEKFVQGINKLKKNIRTNLKSPPPHHFSNDPPLYFGASVKQEY